MLLALTVGESPDLHEMLFRNPTESLYGSISKVGCLVTLIAESNQSFKGLDSVLVIIVPSLMCFQSCSVVISACGLLLAFDPTALTLIPCALVYELANAVPVPRIHARPHICEPAAGRDKIHKQKSPAKLPVFSRKLAHFFLCDSIHSD